MKPHIFFNKVVCTSLICSVLTHQAHANNGVQEKTPSIYSNNYHLAPPSAFGLEYTFQNKNDEILIPIKLLGGVQRPGVYHVPVNTDLLTLITIAGGPILNARLDRLTVKNLLNPNRFLSVNIEKSLSTASEPMSDFKLTADDVVFIDTHKPLFSPDVVGTIGILSGVLGIVLSSILITEKLKQ